MPKIRYPTWKSLWSAHTSRRYVASRDILWAVIWSWRRLHSFVGFAIWSAMPQRSGCSMPVWLRTKSASWQHQVTWPKLPLAAAHGNWMWMAPNPDETRWEASLEQVWFRTGTLGPHGCRGTQPSGAPLDEGLCDFPEGSSSTGNPETPHMNGDRSEEAHNLPRAQPSV